MSTGRRLRSPLHDVRGASIVVGLVAMAIFANSVWNGFAFDDHHIITDNESIQSLRTLPAAVMGPYWPSAYGREVGLWRPTTTAMVGLLYHVGGGSPLPFHIVNVAGHALAAVLVLLLLARLMPLAAALVAAVIFAIHPVHVEAVANAIGIAEILSATAILGACLIHVRGTLSGTWRAPLAIGLLYAVGFGAKESAATLPGLIFLLDAARRRIGFRDLRSYLADTWRVYLMMLLVGFAMLALRLVVLGSVASAPGPLGADLLAEVPRIWTLGEVWAHYVRLWVFPMDLAADYAPNVIPVSLGWHATNVPGVVLALGILALTLLAWRRADMGPGGATPRAAAFGVVWFVIAISPISNVLFISGVALAERTLYLPSVGLAAASGWLVLRLAHDRPRSAALLVIVALTLGSLRTWTRTPVWRSNETLLVNLIEEYPQSGRSQWILGDGFLAQGRVSEALLAYRATIDVLGTYYVVMIEIAKQLMTIEHYRAAEVLLTIAWRNTPEFAAAPGTLAMIRAELGDPEGAERWARASLEADASDPLRRELLAWALASKGEWEEAERQHDHREAKGLSEFWQHWMYLAHARRRAGDTVGAIQASDSALTRVRTARGLAALDSVRVHEFGLAPLPAARTDPKNGGNSRNR